MKGPPFVYFKMQNNVYSQNISNIYIDHKYLLIINDLGIYFRVVPIVLKITIII